MERFWVVGGEYESTDFRRIAGGAEEDRHGPYSSLAAAREKWASLAMATVDNAHVRYRIEKEDAGAYWVIGGHYADASFTHFAPGAEERLGPFKTEREALDVWRGKAWETVDDALARYHIERL
ncbi:MAG: DUF4170 domain-containing protein [Rhodospirillaceae bacterium]|nr:DUF4170 domain-containing protein [Rhodospirillaceae bacterium]